MLLMVRALGPGRMNAGSRRATNYTSLAPNVFIDPTLNLRSADQQEIRNETAAYDAPKQQESTESLRALDPGEGDSAARFIDARALSVAMIGVH